MKSVSTIVLAVVATLVFASPAAATTLTTTLVSPETVLRGGTLTYSPVTYSLYANSGTLNWEDYTYEPFISAAGSFGAGAITFHAEEPSGGVIPGYLYEQKGKYEVCVAAVRKSSSYPPELNNCAVFTVVESTAEAVAKEEAARQKKEEEAAKVKAEEVAKQTQEEAARREAENKAQEAQRNELERQAAATAQEEAARTAAEAAKEAAAKAAKEAKEAAEPCNHETDCPAPLPTAPLAGAQKLTKALKLCKKMKKHSKRVACEKRAKRRYKK